MKTLTAPVNIWKKKDAMIVESAAVKSIATSVTNGLIREKKKKASNKDGNDMKMKEITQDDFYQGLIYVMGRYTPEQLLTIPGLYEVASEELNNEVLDYLTEDEEDEEDEEDMG